MNKVALALPYPAQLLPQLSMSNRAIVLSHLLLAAGATFTIFGLQPVAAILLAAICLSFAHSRAPAQLQRLLQLSWQRLFAHVAVLLALFLWPDLASQLIWLYPLVLMPLAFADAIQVRRHQPLMGDFGTHE